MWLAIFASVVRTLLAMGTYALFYAGLANWHRLDEPVAVGAAVVAAVLIWCRD